MPSSSKPSGIPITTVILSPKNGLPRTSIPTSSMPAGLANKSPSSQNAGHEEQRPNARASHNPRCSPDAHSESLLPHYSRGTRDDLIQRRGIEAMVSYWATNNPVSSVYGGPMIGRIAVWTWDARPYPAWPSRTDAWGDGDLWPLGHWLNGRSGSPISRHSSPSAASASASPNTT